MDKIIKIFKTKKLLDAAKKGHDEEIKVLITEKGVEPDTTLPIGKKRTPLMLAAKSGRSIDMLLECGANKNAKDKKGMTPLMLASKKGRVGIVKSLIQDEKSIEIDVKDKKGRTALMLAIEKNHKETIKLLIENGADTNNIKDKDKNIILNYVKNEDTENLFEDPKQKTSESSQATKLEERKKAKRSRTKIEKNEDEKYNEKSRLL